MGMIAISSVTPDMLFPRSARFIFTYPPGKEPMTDVSEGGGPFTKYVEDDLTRHLKQTSAILFFFTASLVS